MIAILCATPLEMSRLLPLLDDVSEASSPAGTKLVRGLRAGRDILLISAGVGKVAAAAATRFLLDRYSLDLILACGTCGAITDQLKLGDLVIATDLIAGDTGIVHSRGFKPTGPGLCDKDAMVFHPSFAADARLVERARAAAEQTELPYHSGKVLTCDQVVLDPDLRAHLNRSFEALVVEMEGAAVAQVALGDGVPFITIRAVSDEISHDFVGLEKILRYKGQPRRNLWRKRSHLAVTDPSTMAKAREMLQGSGLAMRNLAAFLEVFLDAMEEEQA